MITWRCTKKLMQYLDIKPNANLEPTSAKLGDWYANLVPTMSGDLILFVNEKSLLTLAIPVWEAANLVPLFSLRFINLAGMIGIPPEAAAEEFFHFDRIQYGKTQSRSVLGSMNDIAFQFQVMAERGEHEGPLSLSWAEERISGMPCKPIGYKVPSDIVKELLVG